MIAKSDKQPEVSSTDETNVWKWQIEIVNNN